MHSNKHFKHFLDRKKNVKRQDSQQQQSQQQQQQQPYHTTKSHHVMQQPIQQQLQQQLQQQAQFQQQQQQAKQCNDTRRHVDKRNSVSAQTDVSIGSMSSLKRQECNNIHREDSTLRERRQSTSSRVS